jgi:hypothetical protein
MVLCFLTLFWFTFSCFSLTYSLQPLRLRLPALSLAAYGTDASSFIDLNDGAQWSPTTLAFCSTTLLFSVNPTLMDSDLCFNSARILLYWCSILALMGLLVLLAFCSTCLLSGRLFDSALCSTLGFLIDFSGLLFD